MKVHSWPCLRHILVATLLLAVALSASSSLRAADGVAPVVLKARGNGTSAPPTTTRVASYSGAASASAAHVTSSVLPACYDCPALAGLVPLPAPATTCSCTSPPAVTTTRMVPGKTVVFSKPVVLSPPPAPAPVRTVRVFRPVIPLAPPNPPGNYVVGRGSLGQPKLYVPGQPIRNFLRYLSF